MAGVKVARKSVLTVDAPEIPDSVQCAVLPPPRRDKTKVDGLECGPAPPARDVMAPPPGAWLITQDV